MPIFDNLLPTGSEEREVLRVGSIPVAILPSCRNMKTIALYLHTHEYSWVVKMRKPQRQYSGHNTPLGHHTNRGPMGLGQYNSLGEYCRLSTASSVFRILIWARITSISLSLSYTGTFLCLSSLKGTAMSFSEIVRASFFLSTVFFLVYCTLENLVDAGADPGERGSETSPLLGVTPKRHKEGENVACLCTTVPQFSTYT